MQSLKKVSEVQENVNVAGAIHYALGNIMNQLVFGVSWPEDHPTWKYLVHLQEEGVKHMGVCGAVNFIPILRYAFYVMYLCYALWTIEVRIIFTGFYLQIVKPFVSF